MNSTNDLSQIERSVLEHVQRFRLTVPTAWTATADLRGFPEGEVTKAITQLKRRKLLIDGKLYAGVEYFALSELAWDFLDQRDSIDSGSKFGLLSEQAKMRAVGHLDFCLTKNASWLPATMQEKEALLGTKATGLPSGLVFDRTRSRYCFVRIDSSSSANLARAAQTVRNDLLLIGRNEKLKLAFEHELLQYTFVTATEPRARSIASRVKQYSDMASFKFQARVAPILLPLVLSIPIRRSVPRNSFTQVKK